jgi:hypothetical protein
MIIMKRGIVFCLIFLAFTASAQRKYPGLQGIGLRLGLPTGITYKNYISKWTALELNVGLASPSWSRTYYQNQFNDYPRYDNFVYHSHTVESAAYFQGRYLMHAFIPVEGLEGRVNWYWGIGATFKLAKVNYRYSDPEASPSMQEEVVTDVDLGPEGIIGAEYTFQDVPCAVFAESSLLVEIVDRPGAVRVFGAVGVRYNFP